MLIQEHCRFGFGGYRAGKIMEFNSKEEAEYWIKTCGIFDENDVKSIYFVQRL